MPKVLVVKLIYQDVETFGLGVLRSCHRFCCPEWKQKDKNKLERRTELGSQAECKHSYSEFVKKLM